MSKRYATPTPVLLAMPAAGNAREEEARAARGAESIPSTSPAGGRGWAARAGLPSAQAPPVRCNRVSGSP